MKIGVKVFEQENTKEKTGCGHDCLLAERRSEEFVHTSELILVVA